MPTLADQEASAARGVGRFLALHEDCGAGFEITRNGRGRLHLLCGGCGDHTHYGAADTEELRAHGVDLDQTITGRRFRPSRESVERWLPAPAALPWWIPNAYIVAVILIGLGMIAFGVFRPAGEDRAILGDEDPETQSTPPPEQPAPAPGAVSAGAGPSAEPKAPSPSRSERAPDLRRISVLGRFAVGVPPGWEGGTRGGAVVFAAPAGDAELRVFLQAGETRPGRLSDEAAEFLAREHPEAWISRPERLRLGKARAVELVATYSGGEERAVLLSADGYSYFVLSQVDADASRTARAASVAALRSFRPQ